jgi:hypothetical protein
MFGFCTYHQNGRNDWVVCGLWSGCPLGSLQPEDCVPDDLQPPDLLDSEYLGPFYKWDMMCLAPTKTANMSCRNNY